MKLGHITFDTHDSRLLRDAGTSALCMSFVQSIHEDVCVRSKADCVGKMETRLSWDLCANAKSGSKRANESIKARLPSNNPLLKNLLQQIFGSKKTVVL
jgi:hypothetical protein